MSEEAGSIERTSRSDLQTDPVDQALVLIDAAKEHHLVKVVNNNSNSDDYGPEVVLCALKFMKKKVRCMHPINLITTTNHFLT